MVGGEKTVMLKENDECKEKEKETLIYISRS